MSSGLLSGLKSFVEALRLPYMFAVFLLFSIVEKWFCAEKNQSLKGIFFNVRYTVLYLAIGTLLQPVIGFVTSFIVRSAGGGWIAPPQWSGLGTVGSVLQALTYFLIFDFFYYWFHRFQHTVPVLWSQHKFHHSDTQVNVTTTHRHHWLEEPLRMIFILIPMGILFQVKPVTGGTIGLVLGLWGFFIHSNLRLNLGPLTAVFGGPHAHRIHHSILPQHANRNYAALFPFFDIAFGTFTWPQRSEFPATGLHSHENVSSLVAASWWPFREWKARRFMEAVDRSAAVNTMNVAVLALAPLIFLLSGVVYLSRDSEWVRAFQLPKYAVGNTVEFRSNSPAVQYLREGWSAPEEKLTWMNGSTATLDIPFSRVSSRMKASFLVRAFIDHEKLPTQRYRLTLNGRTLVESDIHSRDPVRIDVDVDAQQAGRILHFTFDAPDASTPKALGISPDERRLGLALMDFRLVSAE